MKRFAMVTMAMLGALFITAPRGAFAQDATCGNTNTTLTGGIVGNVAVMDGSTCRLTNVTVTGNVTVGTGSNLEIDGPSIIGGNIQASNCGYVLLNGQNTQSNSNQVGPGGQIVVGGNVQVKNCSTSSNPWGQGGSNMALLWIGNNTPVPTNVLNGNVQCQNNSGCWLQDIVVGGNVQYNHNPAPPNPPPAGSPPLQIYYNIILGDLQCQGNKSPVYDFGASNIVLGHEDCQIKQ
jgi:hypothetical protein